MSALVTYGDIYGTVSEQIAGSSVPTSAANASGADEFDKVGTAGTNQSFSWLVFVSVLIVIRVLASLAKE